jgi:hypothetical protein
MSSTTFERRTNSGARNVRWGEAQNTVHGDSTAQSSVESLQDRDTEDSTSQVHVINVTEL